MVTSEHHQLLRRIHYATEQSVGVGRIPASSPSVGRDTTYQRDLFSDKSIFWTIRRKAGWWKAYFLIEFKPIHHSIPVRKLSCLQNVHCPLLTTITTRGHPSKIDFIVSDNPVSVETKSRHKPAMQVGYVLLTVGVCSTPPNVYRYN